MFAKLLKQYLKEQRGLMLTLSGAALGAGLLGSILAGIFISNLSDSPANEYSAMGEITIMLIIIGVLLTLYAYVIGVFLYQLYRFYRRHFTDEGYLTFTLPVTTHQLLLSSICNISIWILVSGLVMALSIIMISGAFLYTGLRGTDLSSLDFSLIAGYFGNMMAEMGVNWFSLALVGISSFLFTLILPMASITIGSLAAKKHKLLASFGIYYGISLAVGTLESILSMFTMMGDIIKDQIPSFDSTFLSVSFAHLAIAVGGYFLMHHLMKKKLNLQ